MFITQEKAIEITQQLFIACADDKKKMSAFFEQSGFDTNKLRENIHTIRFLSSFLDFLMGWEATLLEVCAQAQVAPQDIVFIRQALEE